MTEEWDQQARIEQMTPSQREEAQLALLRIYLARQTFGRPERRTAWLARMPPVEKIERWPQNWRRRAGAIRRSKRKS